MKIKNRDQLLSQGDLESRRVILGILEDSLQQMDSYKILREMLHLEGSVLSIGNLRWDLEKKRRIFVVGAGKACNAMARAVEEVMGERISGGLVIVKGLEDSDGPGRIEMTEGGHPIPNEDGLRAASRILGIVDEAGPGDLFIGLISGGSSALMNCPVPGITMEEEREATEALLKSGARILEINAVRRHISATNGGRLGQRIEARGAEMINLIVSDSVGKRPTADRTKPEAFYGTPVAPDGTTLEDARKVLQKYGLSSQVPRSIVEYLKSDSRDRETPKSFSDSIRHFVIARPADACEAAKEAAKKRGLAGFVLTTLLEGESREAGTFLAAVAKEIALNHRPASPPCVLIAGGETTSKIDGRGGLGGPSQELALSFSLEVAGQERFCMGALDTDGTDGPTEIAGGIGDGTTVKRAGEKGLNIHESLRFHDSSALLRVLGDEIVTGNTGTNVCDLNVIYIGGEL